MCSAARTNMQCSIVLLVCAFSLKALWRKLFSYIFPEEQEEIYRCFEYHGRPTKAAPSTGNKKQHDKELKSFLMGLFGELTEQEKAAIKAAADAKTAEQRQKQKAAKGDAPKDAPKDAQKDVLVKAQSTKAEPAKKEDAKKNDEKSTIVDLPKPKDGPAKPTNKKK